MVYTSRSIAVIVYGAHTHELQQQHLPVRNRRRILLRLQTLDMY